MKKTIIAIVAAIASFSSPLLAQTATPAKIGYTDVEFIMGKLPEMKKVTNEVTVMQQQLNKTYEDKVKDYQAKADEYQKTGANLTEVIRADKEKVLRDLGQQIQEFERGMQTSLQGKYQQLVTPIMEKIDKAIKEVGKEGNYLYIISSDAGQAGNPILLYVGSEEYNVTNTVLKKLGVDPNAVEAPATTTTTTPAAKPAAKPATTPAKKP